MNRLRRVVWAPLTVLLSLLVMGADGCPSTAEVGRYWAKLQGAGDGKLGETLSFWVEYREPSNPTGWGFVPKTPERVLAANTPFAQVTEWISGLKPGTTYEYRACGRRADGTVVCDPTEPPARFTTKPASGLQFVKVAPDGHGLLLDDGTPFVPWGNNYVSVGARGEGGKLLQLHRTAPLIGELMYTRQGREAIDRDLDRLRNLTANGGELNVVRLHLEFSDFLRAPDRVNHEALVHFARVVELAEDRGLRLMLVGLGFLYPPRDPAWVGEQETAAHWQAQKLWWNAVAASLKHAPGIFAYDLANEPYPGNALRERDGRNTWGAGARENPSGDPEYGYCTFGASPATGTEGMCFGQQIRAAGDARDANQAALDWVRLMKDGIRRAGPFQNDVRHLITVGIYEYSGAFWSSRPLADELDFLSPHLYSPLNASLDFAARLKAVPSSPKPIVLGEMFPFNGAAELRRLISETCKRPDIRARGWIGQYDGRRLNEPCHSDNPFGCALYDSLYQIEREWSAAIQGGVCPTP